MKKVLLTVKELAAELCMSPKSIQRAYRKGEILLKWLGRMARFDLAKVGRAMERKEPRASSQRQLKTAARNRRRKPPARSEKPPFGKTRVCIATE